MHGFFYFYSFERSSKMTDSDFVNVMVNAKVTKDTIKFYFIASVEISWFGTFFDVCTDLSN